MKFRIYSNQLQKYVAAEEYFVNGNGDVFFFDVMEGDLVKAPEGAFEVEYGKYIETHEGYTEPRWINAVIGYKI